MSLTAYVNTAKGRTVKTPVRLLLAGSLLLMLTAILVLRITLTAVPPKMYLLLSDHLDLISPTISFEDEDILLRISPSIEATRDTAFQMLNVKPEAREWMINVPIQFEVSAEYAGRYDPSSKVLVISQPYVQVFLHEYAHVNFSHKPLLEQIAFAIKLARSYAAPNTSPTLHRILQGTLSLAVIYARQARPIDLVQETYAFVAQSSRGDLNAIPTDLQPYYSDYLQPGNNDWIRWLAIKGEYLGNVAGEIDHLDSLY